MMSLASAGFVVFVYLLVHPFIYLKKCIVEKPNHEKPKLQFQSRDCVLEI